MLRLSVRSRNAIPRLLLLLLPAALSAQGPCPDLPFDTLGRQGYVVRRVDIVGPLPSALNALRPKLPQPMSPVSNRSIEAGKAVIREAIANWRVLFDSPISATVVTPTVTDCTASAPLLLTVRYRFFTTKIPIAVSHTFEARSAATLDPGRSLAAAAERRIQIAPDFGYNRAEQLFGGGRLSIVAPRFFNRFTAQGYASARAARASLFAEGGSDRIDSNLARLDWRIGYDYADRPTDRGPLRDARLSAQFAATSKPIGESGLLWRYAASLEGGSLRSNILSPALLSSTRFGTLKQAAGLTFNSWTQALSLSYGLQLGRVPNGGLVSYSKHIVDLSYDGRLKPLQFESRFNAGVLLRHGPTPLHERFIGDGGQLPFLNGSAWTIRANPVVRSIPNFWLNRGEGGEFGADRFASYNLTASVPTWRHPLVPSEVCDDPEIRDAIDGLLNSAQSIIAVLEKTKDAAHQALFATRQDFQTTIEAVETRALALKAESCADQAGTLGARIADLRQGQYWGPFLDRPADPDDVTLLSLQAVCFTNVQDPELLALASKVEAYRQNIATQIARIDAAKANATALRQMSFPRRTVKTMIEDMDAFSISPVALFDAARVSARTYYAVGGGLRLTLASSVHFTLTYAYNPSRLPGERTGALLFSIGLTNLFGKR